MYAQIPKSGFNGGWQENRIRDFGMKTASAVFIRWACDPSVS